MKVLINEDEEKCRKNNFYFNLLVNGKLTEYRMHNGFLDIGGKEIWENENPEIYELARAYYKLSIIPVSSDDTTP